MAIKTFSDIDLHGAQLKTSRLDNINDENLLVFEGQIAIDTTSDKLKYRNNSGIQVIASEYWVLSQSFSGSSGGIIVSNNLTSGNATTFIDFGTAGKVNLGGALIQNTNITGSNIYNLSLGVSGNTLNNLKSFSNVLYLDAPTINIGYLAGQTLGLTGAHTVTIGYNANAGTSAIGNSSIAIGDGAVSNGVNSAALGYLVSASGANAIAMGQGISKGDNSVDNSFALMFSENLPDYHIVKGKTQTSVNTITTIASYPIAASSSYTIEATFNARDITGTAGNAHSSWTMQALVYRNNSNAAVMENSVPVNVVLIQNANAATWNATLDVSGNNCRALVTGTNTQTINWSVILQITRVG